MTKSMTGYGRGQATDGQLTVTVELKSVNQRFLDLQFRLPRQLNGFEAHIRQLLSTYIQRGKIDVRVCYEDNTERQLLKLDTVKAREYLNVYAQIEALTGEKINAKAALLARTGELYKQLDDLPDQTRCLSLITAACEAALHQFEQMRMTEGAHLAADLNERIDVLRALRRTVAARAKLVPAAQRERLVQRVQAILGEQMDEYYDGQRVATEIAIFADRACIDEELVRLESHFGQFSGLLTQGSGPIGKQLDFIIQEMNREVNTIGSKANDLEITRCVVAMKTEIEKLREQIQNLE